MAYIKLTLDHPIVDGESVTFKAPCDSTEVTGIKVYYVTLTETTATELSKVFTFKDAHGNNLSSIGNLFTTGAYVKVVLDTTNGYAYIQNADTNGYIENTMAKKTDVTGKYTKPSTGIPKTDLAEDVQTLLDKSEVFIATYGTTKSAEIEAAYQARKAVFLSYGEKCIQLTTRHSATWAEFREIDGGTTYRIYRCNSDTWSILNANMGVLSHASTHASGGSDQLYGLYTTDTDPTTNNFINWTYE